MTESVNTGRYSNPYWNLLFCALCGAPMRYERGNLPGTNSYVCSTAYKTGQCAQQRTRFAYVDNLIREALTSEIDLANKAYEHIELGYTVEITNNAEKQFQDETARIMEIIRKANTEFQLLNTEFCVGNISPEKYQQEKQKLYNATRTASQQVLNVIEDVQNVRTLFSKDNPWLQVYYGKNLTHNLRPKAFLKQAILSPDGDITITLREQIWKNKLLDLMEV